MLYPPGDCNYPKLVNSAVVLMLDHPLCGGVRENYVSVTRSLKLTVGKEGIGLICSCAWQLCIWDFHPWSFLELWSFKDIGVLFSLLMNQKEQFIAVWNVHIRACYTSDVALSVYKWVWVHVVWSDGACACLLHFRSCLSVCHIVIDWNGFCNSVILSSLCCLLVISMAFPCSSIFWSVMQIFVGRVWAFT